MLIDLLKSDQEGIDIAKLQGKRRNRTVVLAVHGTISHVIGEPCIHLFPKVKWHNYPLVHSRNIIPIIIHESIHCALQSLFGTDMALEGDGFDSVMPHTSDMRRLLRPAVHKIRECE